MAANKVEIYKAQLVSILIRLSQSTYPDVVDIASKIMFELA